MAYSAEIEEESSEKINSCSSIVRCVLCSRFPLSARLWFFLTLLKYASEHSILIIQSTSPQLFLPPSLARTHTSACREREYYNVLLGFYGRRLRRRHRERREEEEEEKERQHQILRPGFVALTNSINTHTHIRTSSFAKHFTKILPRSEICIISFGKGNLHARTGDT